MAAQEVRTLRAITYRISAASSQDLYTVIPSAARHLLDCRSLLSLAPQNRKESAEGVVLHKFQTQVNTFLSARTPEGRWAATLLIKAAVEVGSYEVLSKSSSWVRGLLHNLNKPDPPSSKKLIIVTLTRIFLLTHGHQTLERELAIPCLKDFIPICLNLVSPKSSGALSDIQKRLRHLLLPTVLDSFAHLITSHPSIFRPHISQIKDILVVTVSSNTARSRFDEAFVTAVRLFALLHFSAQKTKTSSPAEAYISTINNSLASLHLTMSLVFRSVVEDWSPLPANDVPKPVVANDAQLDSSAHLDSLGLPAWNGIHSGIARLYDVLLFLGALIQAPSSEQISVPLGNIMDVIIRLCSTTAPQPTSHIKTKAISLESGLRVNDQVSQTERDALFTELPCIHASALDLISTLCMRLGAASKPLHEAFIEQIAWVFQRESSNTELRASCYRTLSNVLDASGASIAKSIAQQYVPILHRCCEDILSSAPARSTTSKESINGLDADVLASQKKSSTSYFQFTHEPTTVIVTAANHLLFTALKSIPPGHLPSRVRSKLDSTAILSQNKDAMLASVLNPALATKTGAKTPASILPFLARADPQSLTVEALLRPRAPAIRAVEAHGMSEDESTHEDDRDTSSEEHEAVTADGPTAQTSFGALAPLNAVDVRQPYVFPEEGNQSTESGIKGSAAKRAASPPAPNTDMDPPTAAKRQRLTPDLFSTALQPKQPAKTTISQPVISPAAPSANTREFETARSRPVISPTSAVRQGLSTPHPATSLTAAAVEDSDDDSTMPEISLEMDTEDEEDDGPEDGSLDDADADPEEQF